MRTHRDDGGQPRQCLNRRRTAGDRPPGGPGSPTCRDGTPAMGIRRRCIAPTLRAARRRCSRRGGGGCAMLSEHEREALRDIERRLRWHNQNWSRTSTDGCMMGTSAQSSLVHWGRSVRRRGRRCELAWRALPRWGRRVRAGGLHRLAVCQRGADGRGVGSSKSMSLGRMASARDATEAGAARAVVERDLAGRAHVSMPVSCSSWRPRGSRGRQG